MAVGLDSPPKLMRAETPAAGGGRWRSTTASECLPADLVDGAVRRLGLLALFYAGSFIISRFLEQGARGMAPLALSPYPLLDLACIGGTVTGAIFCLVA